MSRVVVVGMPDIVGASTSVRGPRRTPVLFAKNVLDVGHSQNYSAWVLPIEETMPDHFADDAEAARARFCSDQGSDLKLTGIVDSVRSTDGRLQLIFCGNQTGLEICLRERFDIRRVASFFDVGHAEEAQPEFGSVALWLDSPSAGERSGWTDEVTARHDFTVLLFYRGF